MQQDKTTQMIDPGLSAYMTLLAVQREVGIIRGTLKKYLTYLGIEPICFHIGTRSLYISREALLAHLPSPVISRGSSEGKDASDGR